MALPLSAKREYAPAMTEACGLQPISGLLIRHGCVRQGRQSACTPADTAWPFSVRTVVEQPENVARSMSTPRVERRIVRIVRQVYFLNRKSLAEWVSVRSSPTKFFRMRIAEPVPGGSPSRVRWQATPQPGRSVSAPASHSIAFGKTGVILLPSPSLSRRHTRQLPRYAKGRSGRRRQPPGLSRGSKDELRLRPDLPFSRQH